VSLCCAHVLQGNIQRCQQFVARLDEARNTLLSVTETHKQRVADIIGRHQSKRVVKKKERLWTGSLCPNVATFWCHQGTVALNCALCCNVGNYNKKFSHADGILSVHHSRPLPFGWMNVLTVAIVCVCWLFCMQHVHSGVEFTTVQSLCIYVQ